MNPSIDFSTLPLRDIHLPEPVAWWPLAAGWWLLLGALVVAIAFAGWQRYRYRRHRAALAEVERIAAELAGGAAPHDCVQRLSVVARRFAMTLAAGRDADLVPGLIGERWLEYLDAHGGNGSFRTGPGRLLANAPYARPDSVQRDDVAALCGVVADWIKSQRPPGLAPSALPAWIRPRRLVARKASGG